METIEFGRIHDVIGGTYNTGRIVHQPLILGFSGQVFQYKNLTAVAGVNTNDSDIVPANTLWVITNIDMRYTGTVATVALYCNVFDGTIAYCLYSQQPILSGYDYDRQGRWILKAGDRFRMSVTNATAGDNIRLYLIGYYIDLAFNELP